MKFNANFIDKINTLSKLPVVGIRICNFFINFLFADRHQPYQKVTIRRNGVQGTLYINIFDYSHVAQTMGLQYGLSAFKFFDQNIEKDTKESVFFDFGANIGLYSLYCLKKFNIGKVVCVEPNPLCIGLLQKTFLDFDVNHVKIYGNLLSNVVGSGILTERVFNSGSGTAVGDWGNDELPEHFTRTFEVENISANDIIKSELGLGQKACIKMDIQGFEAGVLSDLTDETISQFVKFIFFEVNHKHLEKLVEQIERYRKMGFRLLNDQGHAIKTTVIESLVKKDVALVK